MATAPLATNIINGHVKVLGKVIALGGLGVPVDRDELTQEDGIAYPVPLFTCFNWSTGQPLPSSPASDNLALVPGTFGTASPSLSSGDLHSAGSTTRRARCVLSLPAEYVAGQTIQFRASAAMLAHLADTLCTLLIEAYQINRDLTVSSNLVTTAAQSMNSLTFADLVYAVTATALEPGNQLDVRVSITCSDASTSTAVTAIIASLELLLDIQG